MSKVVVIAGRDLCMGFALAGVPVVPVTDAGGAREAVEDAAASDDCGLLIVDERYAGDEDGRIHRLVDRSNRPLIVLVPASMRWRSHAEDAPDDYAARLVSRAIGYQLAIDV